MRTKTIWVGITTYDRPGQLAELLEQLTDCPPDIRLLINVYKDGGSNADYSSLRARYASIKWTEYPHNLGKKRHYQMWCDMIGDAAIMTMRHTVSSCLFLPDDCILLEPFWNKLRAEYGNCTFSLMPDRRIYKENWGNTKRWRLAGKNVKTGWFDGAGIISTEIVQLLAKNPIYVPLSRWAKDNSLGSGVGQALTHKIREYDCPMYHTRVPAVAHRFAEVSKMNPGRDHELRPFILDRVHVGIATIPGRERQLAKTLDSLSGQYDAAWITCNGDVDVSLVKSSMQKSPTWNEITFLPGDNSRGDAVKFDPLHMGQFTDAYYMTLDDDLILPHNYTRRMIEAIESYSRSSVVGVHGKVLPQRVDKFYKGHLSMFHTSSELKKDQVVNCIGTGLAAFHTDTIMQLNPSVFMQPNMADIWFSGYCSKNGIPMIAIKRPANWVGIQHVPWTIYEQEHKDDHRQVEAWNRLNHDLNIDNIKHGEGK